ncbi:hypothetical protein FNF29_02180 [Cafeteria roenbergensis]|uniref:Uncharacterized protein n=1 Tax=Cafeteria roenbergensis TaxID=33653 RepID=A0A5A8CPK4_CAFRO|nr:hypothetical protein FNF29_02180 [Cafeteria roenbergensis]|eukprot:KAA0154649.1 hypothetical protein FNF29_02180 [Cafeteria roenbergensis]
MEDDDVFDGMLNVYSTLRGQASPKPDVSVLGYSGAPASRDTSHPFSDMATCSPLLGPASSQALHGGFASSSALGPGSLFSGLSPVMQHGSAGPHGVSAGPLQLPRAAVSSPMTGACAGPGMPAGSVASGFDGAVSAAHAPRPARDLAGDVPFQARVDSAPLPGQPHSSGASWRPAGAASSVPSSMPVGHHGAAADTWSHTDAPGTLGGKAVMLARRGGPAHAGVMLPMGPAPAEQEPARSDHRQHGDALRSRHGGKSGPTSPTTPRAPAAAAAARSAGAAARSDSRSDATSTASPAAAQSSPGSSDAPPSRGGRSARRGAAGRRVGEPSKKRRFLWDHELHRAFIAAVFDIGVRQATPKSLFEAMRAILVQGMPVELDDGQPIPGGSAGLAGYGGRDGPLHSAGMVKAAHGGAKRQAAADAGGGAAGRGSSASGGAPAAVQSMAVLRHDGCPDNMTSEHIKSHLQKFRANVRKSRDAFLQDYARAMREARARASEEEAKTGAVANPPGFSTFPMAMPVHMQPERPPMHRPDGSLLYPPAMDAQVAARLLKASKRRGGAARAKAEAALAAAGAQEPTLPLRRSKRSRSDASLKDPGAGALSKPSMWPGGAPTAAEVEVDVPLCSTVDEAPGLLAFPAACLDDLAGAGAGGSVFRGVCQPDAVDASAVSLDAGALAARLLDALDGQGIETPDQVRAMLPGPRDASGSPAKRPRAAAPSDDGALAHAAGDSSGSVAAGSTSQAPGAGALEGAAAAALRALALLAQAQVPRVEKAPVRVVARLSLGQLAPAMVEAGLDTTSLMWPLLGPGAVGPLGPQHWKDPLWAAVTPETGEEDDPSEPQASSGGAVSLPTVPASLEGLIKTMQKRQTVHRTMQLQQADQARKYSAHPSAAGSHPPTALDTVQALAGPISHLHHLQHLHHARQHRAMPAGPSTVQAGHPYAKAPPQPPHSAGAKVEQASPFQSARAQPLQAPSPGLDRPGSHLADGVGGGSGARRRRASSLGLGLSMSPGADSDGGHIGEGRVPSPALFSFLADGFQ